MNKKYRPMLVAWELTRACNLKCSHCRASSIDNPEQDELTTKQAKEVINEIAEIGNILILTGGEPLMRNDIYKIAEYANKKELRVVLATNGTTLDKTKTQKMIDAGIQRVSISIDGATPKSHDNFRGIEGAYQQALDGIEILQKMKMPFQINTTITKQNVDELPELIEMAEQNNATAHHIFMLVPTGRGENLKGNEITPKKYEEILEWFYNKETEVNMELKATCAPHYYRILSQKGGKFKKKGLDMKTGGCLGGKMFCFISRTGEVYPCGYLPLTAGNVLEQKFTKIWNQSTLFKNLRNPNKLKGKCGECEYKKLCGGCRARAYAKTKNYLSEEPYCIHQPKKTKNKT
ncbi:Radical SAM superfamily enzyme [Methanonatronarchaeum thermophilum]|uniref:Radical SAM superfamily enzyme n=1 Tax=Methanonatronarchaeum thermophilum TaxID=1927129 RepID=A0A1Y3GCU5_9EURY|nr:heme b synthase [Methanonatronarchaeum thermophilum]OUJ19060.1 Radical SAM superfamily enzyme [Methanonatronarchaeum thermophilum]